MPKANILTPSNTSGSDQQEDKKQEIINVAELATDEKFIVAVIKNELQAVKAILNEADDNEKVQLSNTRVNLNNCKYAKDDDQPYQFNYGHSLFLQASDHYYPSLLTIAIDCGYSAMAQQLITAGASVDAVESYDSISPLALAVKRGMLSVTTALLGKAANVNVSVPNATIIVERTGNEIVPIGDSKAIKILPLDRHPRESQKKSHTLPLLAQAAHLAYYQPEKPYLSIVQALIACNANLFYDNGEPILVANKDFKEEKHDYLTREFANDKPYARSTTYTFHLHPQAVAMISFAISQRKMQQNNATASQQVFFNQACRNISKQLDGMLDSFDQIEDPKELNKVLFKLANLLSAMGIGITNPGILNEFDRAAHVLTALAKHLGSKTATRVMHNFNQSENNKNNSSDVDEKRVQSVKPCAVTLFSNPTKQPTVGVTPKNSGAEEEREEFKFE